MIREQLTVGYVDSLAYEGGEKEYEDVKKRLTVKKRI